MKLRNALVSGLLMAGIAMTATCYAADQQPAAAPAAKSAFSTAQTDIGTLLDNPQTKAVLDKHIPQFAANPQIQMARGMTLRQIQSFAGDMLTDEVLGKIDADLAKVPKVN